MTTAASPAHRPLTDEQRAAARRVLEAERCRYARIDNLRRRIAELRQPSPTKLKEAA